MVYMTPAIQKIIEKAVQRWIKLDFNPRTGMVSISPDGLRTMIHGLVIIALNEGKYARRGRKQSSPTPSVQPAFHSGTVLKQ